MFPGRSYRLIELAGEGLEAMALLDLIN